MNSGFVSPASGIDLGNAYRVRRKRGGLNNTTSQLENCPIRERPPAESIHRNRYNRSKAPDPYIRVPRGVESRSAARKGLILGVFYPKVDVVPPRGGTSSELGGVIHVAHPCHRAYCGPVDSSHRLRLLPSNHVAPGLRALLSSARRVASGGNPWPAARHDQLPAAGTGRHLRTMTVRSLGGTRLQAPYLTATFPASRTSCRAAPREGRILPFFRLHLASLRAYFPRQRCWRCLAPDGPEFSDAGVRLGRKDMRRVPPGTHTPTRNRGIHHALTSNLAVDRPRGRPRLLGLLLPPSLRLASPPLLRSCLRHHLLPPRR